jgi:DNA repair protein RecO (recombination protein O)
MHIKTRGFILHVTRYSDTASVITIYTEQLGRLSFMQRGFSGKKSIVKAALTQPLLFVDIEFKHQPGKEMHTISEISVVNPHTNIATHPVKNALVLFIAELLFRTIKHSHEDEQLFQHIAESLLWLNETQESLGNFHLVFMYMLAESLGIEPNMTSEDTRYFDLMHGELCNTKPLHTHYTGSTTAARLKNLSELNYENAHTLKLTRSERDELLQVLVEYFKIHISGFRGLNSIEVLHALFE